MTIDDLVGLDLFVDAVKLGSISAAARRHGVTQPSATEQIRRLERRLGLTLLERGPGGSAPTAAGAAVAEWARPVIAAADELANGVAALRADAGTRRTLPIAASLTIAEYVLPQWLRRHREAGGPPVELEVENSVAVARAVDDGRVRLGFVESPRRFPGLKSTVVGGDRLVVVVAAAHAWTRRRSPLSPAQLAATPLLLREPGSGTREFFETALARAGSVIVEPAGVLGSTTALKAAAVDGDAPTVLSELAVRQELADASLVEIPVDGLAFERDFRALWRADRDNADIRRFVASTRAPMR
jgi:molybdate transport repressor ModE-like protein